MNIMKKVLCAVMIVSTLPILSGEYPINPDHFHCQLERSFGVPKSSFNNSLKGLDKGLEEAGKRFIYGLEVAVKAVPTATMMMLSAGAEFTATYPHIATVLALPALYVTYKLCQGTARVARSISKAILG